MKRVSAGIIIKDHKILVAQRKHGKSLEYYWEFPGGKQEAYETMPECLERELKEELGIDVKAGEFFMNSLYEYEFGTISLHAYFVDCNNQEVPCHIDHEQIKWVGLDELADYNFAPADRPIVEKLLELKKI